MMRHFLVHYMFRPGINGTPIKKETEITFDDIDPETTEPQLKQMAINEVNQRFTNSDDYPLYGKFWEILEVEEINY